MANFSDPSVRSLKASVGNVLSFEWSENHKHNVYLLPDKNAFDNCEFSNADFIGSSSPTRFTLDSFPTYFGCEMACNAGHKLAVLGEIAFIDYQIKENYDVYEPLPINFATR